MANDRRHLVCHWVEQVFWHRGIVLVHGLLAGDVHKSGTRSHTVRLACIKRRGGQRDLVLAIVVFIVLADFLCSTSSLLALID